VRALHEGIAQSADDVAHLAQRVAHVDAERLIHHPVPDPEPEQQPAAGEFLDRGGLLREQRGMAEVDVRDGGPDLQPRGRVRHGLRVGERVVERLGDEDRLVAQLLGAPGPRYDVGGRGVAQRGEGKTNAVIHGLSV
jgi:hypothetical protein